MKKAVFSLLLVLLMAVSACAEVVGYDALFAPVSADGRLSVRFLWLGEQIAEDKPGDCMILTSPDGKVMVLDAGHPLAVSYVTQALDQMQITRIDYLVASHPHIDHIGGMAALMDRYEVGAVYSSELWYDTSTYNDYMAAIARNQVEHIILHEGDSFMFGEQVEVKVFNPPKNVEYFDGYPESSTRFVNNHSLALKFCFGSSSILLAGDLYSDGERNLIDHCGEALDADVTKANHHGCPTSSSVKWRKAVSPMITVITNDLLEDIDIAKKFNKGEAEMYHTFLDGSVMVTTPGDGTYEVKTENARTTNFFDD